jgi:predicted transcriptional regulator
VTDDFKILLEFFDGDAQEVAGRETATIPAELREKIAKFASGKCTEEERAEMKKLLQEKPQFIPTLVTETKALRQAPE